MKPNFSGYATKYGVLCTDGRTIVADAFGHEDGKRLPLLWRHDDSSPENILGHVILKHEKGIGIKAKAFFNKTARGEHSRQMVEHEDIDMLSIKAVRLRQNGASVTHGDLTEVSLVPHGANKEARIESVYLQHDDGMLQELENEGIIYSGLTLSHADEDEDEEKPEDEDSEDTEDEDEEEVEQEDSGQTVQEVYDSFTDDQKLVVAALIDAAQKDAKHEDPDGSETLNHEGETMPNNVFDKTDAAKSEGAVLTHEQMDTIFETAKRNGSMKEAILAHAEPYGITNIEDLFPDAKKVRNTPDWIKRDDSWVAGVLSAVHRSPFSRIKSMTADVTHEDARAKGYIKGNMKKDEYYSVAQRVTTPTTMYKKQKLDRDDIIDVTDFDVVAWIKEEMRWMLQEETARAFLFGDGRDPGDDDKIPEIHIRPIATDDDFYTSKVMINANIATKTLAAKILRSRKLLKGATGKATLYTTDDLVIDMLLMEDQTGRRYYETEASLAAALGVKNIVVVDVLDEGYEDENGNSLLGVMVNLQDYTVGADRGGQTSMFDDFDIDFNQYKYLIEHRLSAALTRHHSALSLWTSSAQRILPEEPDMTGVNELTIPDQEGVVYLRTVLGEPDEDISGDVITLTEANTPYTVKAVADTGFRFPLNVTTTWSFNWTDPES